MIEDFKKQNVVRKTTQASTEREPSKSTATPVNRWIETTLKPYQQTTAAKEDNKTGMNGGNMDSPNMDSPEMDPSRMQEPETLPTPESPCGY